jgi:hypothetical protein
MKKTIRAKGLAVAVAVSLVSITFLVIQVPGTLGCTFAALKSVTLTTDPPRPVKGRPFTLTGILFFGGGMGHGNMLTAAENAISATLTLPGEARVIEGVNPLQTTTPVFNLGYEIAVPLTWKLVTERPGQQYIHIQVENTTLGQGQESAVSWNENGLLGWEVVRPEMKDARIEAGDKDAIDKNSLALMPSLRLKAWRALPNGDILFTDADGTRYSVKAGELDLGEDDPSPIIATDAKGNRYLATDGRIIVVEGPEVFAPTARPGHPNPKDPMTIEVKIVGSVEKGKTLLFYSTDGSIWQRVELGQMPSENLWKGEIPAQVKDGLTINYYLEVTDSAGRTVTSPRYSVRVVDRDRVAEGVRNVALLALAHIIAAIGVVTLWAKWDLARKVRHAKAGQQRILAGDQMPLQPQWRSGMLAQLRRPVSSDAGCYWQIAFYVLVILGILLTIVGVITNQFQIINLIIRMG